MENKQPGELFIAIATHKELEIPKYEGYYTVLAGAAFNREKCRPVFDHYDDRGIHISGMNKFLCEMTVMYWLWKNVKSPFVGLVHYRRFFYQGQKKADVWSNVLKKADVMELMQHYDLVLPIKKSYFPMNVEKYYALRHEKADMDEVTRIVHATCGSEYIKAYEAVLKGYSLHLYNMFFSRRELFEAYMEWVMPILMRMEQKKVYLDKTPYQARVIAFIAERLFNVWVKANEPKLRIKYLPVKGVGLESEAKKGMDVVFQILKIKSKR